MASDNHVAAALTAFATDVRQDSRFEPGTILTPAEASVRRRRLEELAADADALAASPRTATYQGFERILKQVRELGASPSGEIIIGVASAFMQRPHFSVRYDESTPTQVRREVQGHGEG
jgi:hypothetical protein